MRIEGARLLFVWKDVGCRAYLVLGRNNIVFIRLACAVCMEGRLVVTALLWCGGVRVIRISRVGKRMNL